MGWSRRCRAGRAEPRTRPRRLPPTGAGSGAAPTPRPQPRPRRPGGEVAAVRVAGGMQDRARGAALRDLARGHRGGGRSGRRPADRLGPGQPAGRPAHRSGAPAAGVSGGIRGPHAAAAHAGPGVSVHPHLGDLRTKASVEALSNARQPAPSPRPTRTSSTCSRVKERAVGDRVQQVLPGLVHEAHGAAQDRGAQERRHPLDDVRAAGQGLEGALAVDRRRRGGCCTAWRRAPAVMYAAVGLAPCRPPRSACGPAAATTAMVSTDARAGRPAARGGRAGAIAVSARRERDHHHRDGGVLEQSAVAERAPECRRTGGTRTAGRRAARIAAIAAAAAAAVPSCADPKITHQGDRDERADGHDEQVPVVEVVLPVALASSARAVAVGASYQRAWVFGRGGRRMPSM